MVVMLLRGHLSAWLTAAFAALLLLLTLTDQGPGGAGANLIILLAAVALLGVFFATEQVLHRGEQRGKP